MHSSVWLLLVPPIFAVMVSQIIRYSPRVGFPSIPFTFGKYGFWTVLVITYVSMFVVAVVQHKI